MRDRRHALLWAIGWWLLRRQVRRRATLAIAGIGSAATPRRPRRLLGVLVIVGLVAGGFVLWRRLAGGDDGWGEPSVEPVEPVEPAAPPSPPEPVAA